MRHTVRRITTLGSALLAAACATDTPAAPRTAVDAERAVQARIDALNWALVDWYAVGGRGSIVAVAVDTTQPQHLFLVKAR